MDVTTVSSEVKASFHDDGIVLLDINGGTVFRSNRVGAAIWKGLSNCQELAGIAAQISRDYSIPFEQAFDDARAFVTQLESRGLLSRHAGVRP